MTGLEVIAKAYETQPHLRLAISKSGSAIGAWDQAKDRFVMVAGEILTGQWANMPMELLVNGNPPVPAGDWSEVTK